VTGPTFDGFNLVVSDMEATIAFYRRLGLTIDDLQPEWAEWAPHHRNAKAGEGAHLDFDSVEFARVWDEGWRGSNGGVFSFSVETREAVDAIYDDLTSAGYRGSQPPYDAFFGSRYAVVEDPDGNAVGIRSPVDESRRGPAPSVESFERGSAG
jgi:uncharacterized glyoxalase superfamily protein PhnB